MSDMVTVDKRKLEVLKVFYAVFSTLMDSQFHEPQMSDTELLSKLRRLNARLKNEVMERGALN
jgi:hypothetical protein